MAGGPAGGNDLLEADSLHVGADASGLEDDQIPFDERVMGAEIAFPALITVDGIFAVAYNPVLTTLSAPLVSDVMGSINITDNPSLTNCDVGSPLLVGDCE